MHPGQASNFDLLAGAYVVNRVSLFKSALVDPDIGQLSVLSVLQFEGQRHNRCFRIAGEDDRFFVIFRVERFIFDICGAGQQPVDRIQKRLNPFIFIGGTHEYRGDFPGENTLADGFINHLFGDFLLFQDRLGKVV